MNIEDIATTGNWAFHAGGSGGFLNNHYVVWAQGLKPDAPNITAAQVGTRTAASILDAKGATAKRNSAQERFVVYLEKLQQKEEAKETAFLSRELSHIARPIDPKILAAAKSAIDNKDFGVAYSLLTEYSRSLEKIKQELTSGQFQSVQKQSSFWNAQFTKEFVHRLMKGLEMGEDRLLTSLSNQSLTVEELVDDWIDKVLSGSKGNVINESLDSLSQMLKNSIYTSFDRQGISIDKNSNLYDVNYNKILGTSTIKGKTGKLYKPRAKKTKIETIVKILEQSILKGVSSELEELKRSGTGSHKVTFSAGTLAKDLKENGQTVYQKTDTVSIVAFNETFNMGDMANELYKIYSNAAGDRIAAIVRQLEEQGKLVEDLFTVETNVKGYKSNYDLQIEGEGSFKNRARNLATIPGMPANMMNKLIFLLNNTVDGAVAAGRTKELGTYIAAVVAAWVWDDYDQLLNIDEQSTIQRVRMFYSGSMYYSASEIMKIGIDQLKAMLNNEKGDSFIKVSISPVKFDAEKKYLGLRDGEEGKKEGTIYPVGATEEEAQEVLKKRWDIMRNYVEENSTMEIKFDQKKLDLLLGQLGKYI